MTDDQIKEAFERWKRINKAVRCGYDIEHKHGYIRVVGSWDGLTDYDCLLTLQTQANQIQGLFQSKATYISAAWNKQGCNLLVHLSYGSEQAEGRANEAMGQRQREDSTGMG